MRVAIVGCGVEGSALAGGLATEPDIDGLVLVSRDGKRAEELRARLAGLKGCTIPVECRAADSTDEAAVATAVAGAGVVVNAALPDSNLPTMRACLETGAHYLDMLTMGFEGEGIPREMTLDGLLDLDADFRAAGLVSIPNTGAAPGATDVFAWFLAQGLDEVVSASVAWADRSNATELVPPFAPDLLYQVCMPQPKAWKDGQLVDVDLFGSIELVDWPAPLGRMMTITGCVDPETRTLQYVLPGAAHIEVRAALAIGPWDDWLKIWAEGVRRQVASGTTPGVGVTAGEWLASGFGKAADYGTALEQGIITENSFGILVRLTGTADGVSTIRTITMHTTLDEARAAIPWQNAMAHITAQSTPRQLVAMLARDEIPERGVVPSVGTLAAAGALVRSFADRGFIITEEVSTPGGVRRGQGLGPRPLDPAG